jgi:signal transduction histidine kinase
MRVRSLRLPIRIWLVLTVNAVAILALSFEFGVTGNLESAGQQQAVNTRVMKVQETIGNNPARWRGAVWKRRATSALRAQGVDVAIFRVGQSTPSFATSGARRYLATTVTGNDSRTARVPYNPPSTVLPVFQRLIISGPGGTLRGVAFLWYTDLPPGEPSVIWWFVGGFGSIWLLVGVVLLLLERPVLRPLSAMSRAAEGIAGGDLDVHLPSSPVREIAEVSAALEGMSHALRDSLARQRALEEDRRLFVGAVAHDLRTPLFMLRGYLKGLETGVAATPEKIAHYVHSSLAKADALERLIADLFAFTRLEYLEQEPDRAPLELGALLRSTADGARPLAAEKQIEIVLDGPEEPCSLLGDAHLLGRAVENLLDNALRHTPARGQTSIRWGRMGDTLTFSVEDTGPGIAEEDLPHLFAPLYRAERSRSRQTGGAGLGLTIARRILRAHGGDLIASNAPAGGAVFTATLPVRIGTEMPPAGQEAAIRS